ncbi:MAG TPA: alpha/beta hydrolase-fold protein [Solirubrobacteraceae bacterium]|jgi:enterochelin esterase-like enzyme|nr:alpha/beta hydrolase-fold protein [Solirubrobacteraceae bacterium]
MSAATKTSRVQVWMDGPGEWSWPGRAAEAVQALPQPPSWVPALPPRLESAAAGAHGGAAGGTRSGRGGALGRSGANPRLVVLATLISGLIAACCAILLLHGPGGFERVLGASPATPTPRSLPARVTTSPTPLPTLVTDSRDAAGSSIDTASYRSAAIEGQGSFHVYLPPGFASTSARYPVLYLLHGNDQPATAFLQLGLQHELDRLIATHEIPPLIAVMIQGGRGANNWRDHGNRGYESYVIEVQGLVDRMLPTLATRSARAIAGDSMGGYGAMNVALGNPRCFSIVESWLGFFNGLDDELRAARGVIERDGLHAYLYGGASDDIADPSENAPFAAQLREVGASAHSAVYVGGHTMETLEAHLHHMLLYVGRSLQENASKTAKPSAAAESATTKSAP